METRTYYYRGQIERGTATAKRPRPGYRWVDGWSTDGPDGSVAHPWQTRAECRAEAKQDGVRAIFVREDMRSHR